VSDAIGLSPNELRRTCRPSEVPFATTADAAAQEGGDGVLGQERAAAALRFGLGIRRPGYHLFAIGPAGVGKHTLLRQMLGEHAAREKVPPDCCYVHDFADPEKPRVLELPAGMGIRLQRDMEKAVAELRVAMRTAFESEEYRTRRKQILDRLKERQQRALGEVRERARQRDVAVMETESGIVLAPILDGAPIDADRFHALPEEQQEKFRAELTRVGADLQEMLRSFHGRAHEHHEEMQALDREMAATAAHRVFESVRQGFADQPTVLAHLADVERDVLENANQFIEPEGEGFEAAFRRAMRYDQEEGTTFRRYRINLLVDRSALQGAPVVFEDHPTYPGLVGRIEHEAQFGALVANFTLVRAGALHRARGGYLVLDALKLLQQPYGWEALKRTIRSGEIRIDSLAREMGLASTVALEPAPIALGDTKIVLCGERQLYYLLASLDPDFAELFKVLVDFEESMDRRPESQAVYARRLAALVRTEGLRPFDRGAIARVVEQAARATGDAGKLSVRMGGVVDLLREADYWAGDAHRACATADDVQQAIDAQILRADRVRRRLQEAIQREDILVSTTGESVGQVNGLSIFQLGEHQFGHPARITARVRLGKGELIDIEREVDLGGPIHSKGVLILGGFLGSRYAPRTPLSLSATLVFEQSYGTIEGDSASLAELCALLSALAEAPVRQGLAVTGSVNQQGEVQSIGGVNEKIEGFFDVCRERGLTGDQGVLIPKSNVKNLMLRQDVVEAVESKRFRVHAVSTVDEAIALLTGRPAGARDSDGRFSDGSVNARAEARLVSFAENARSFLGKPATR
jgi:predicted ATP-dependent protease